MVAKQPRGQAVEPAAPAQAGSGRALDLAVIALVAAGLLTLLGLLGASAGVLTEGWAGLLRRWLGWGVSLVTPVARWPWRWVRAARARLGR